MSRRSPFRLAPVFLAALLCVSTLTAASDQFNFPNFNGTITWFQTNFFALDMADRVPLNSTPQYLRLMWNNGYGNDPYRLDRGAVWYTRRMPVTGGFMTMFSFRITPPAGQTWTKGDGFAFVLQDHDVHEIGDGTWGLGYNRTDRGLAIEFDIADDNWSPDFDPNDNHVAVVVPTTESDGSVALYSYRPLAVAPVAVNLADGRTRFASVTYIPPIGRATNGTIIVYVYGASGFRPVLSASVPDLSAQFASGMALIGFTAGRSVDAGRPIRTADIDIASWSFAGRTK